MGTHKQTDGRYSRDSYFAYWLLKTGHYLSGLIGIIASVFLAKSPDFSNQTIPGIIALVSILAFALTQEDLQLNKPLPKKNLIRDRAA